MFFWLRLCFGFLILVPSLAVAQPEQPEQPEEPRRYELEIPSNGDTLSGIGVISGWKCEDEGEITVQVDDGESPSHAVRAVPVKILKQCVKMTETTAL